MKQLMRATMCCALVLTACGGSDDATSVSETSAVEGTEGGQPESGDSPSGTDTARVDADAALRLVGANAPQQMDPVLEASPCSESMLGLIYDRLIRITPDAELVPGLAASWSAPDPTTFELILREGVQFQDGSPFDADAVVEHLTRSRDAPGSVLAGNLADVESIEAVDETTVRLNLSKPRAGVLPYILSPGFRSWVGLIGAGNGV